jgi:GTPase SAR1 family protein
MSSLGALPIVVPAVLGAMVSALLTWILAARRMPVAHRVAIIGFPKAGKTTLITAIFEYLFRRGAKGRSVVPRGDETRRRINENLAQLELRRPVKPTTDQDVFAYRAEVTGRPGSLSRRYKLEIGDFPGEDTVRFAEQFGEWLHDTPYFEWAASADAFVFVADSSSILSDQSGEYVARQKSAFRAAWQRLREHHLDGTTNLSSKPVLLVFSKADLLRQLSPSRRYWGFDDSIPERKQLTEKDEAHLREGCESVRTQFRDLIDYFSRESALFRVIFVSVFAELDGERLGIPELTSRVLPRRAWVPPLPRILASATGVGS